MSLARSRNYREFLAASARLVGLPTWRYQGYVYAPEEWLEGLVLTESGGNPEAVRYEPHQDRAGRRDQASDGDTPGVDDGRREDDTSYGLMQVMGYNIRRLVGAPPGTPLDFSFALLPITNVSLGLRVLIGELGAVGYSVPRALARYNGGPTGDDGSPMRRQVYVDHVFENSVAVQQDRRGG